MSDEITPEMLAKFTALRHVFEVQERGRLTAEQYRQLLRPIDPKRVLHANRQSHVAQQDITAHLTRIFGFEGWDKEIKELRLLRDVIKTVPAKTDDQGRTIPERQVPGVSYLCMLRLTIRDSQGRVVTVKEDVGTGTSPNLPDYGDAHDFASKNAVSYALKRCAKDLGDQYGLSLYNKGQLAALVVGSLMDPVLTDGPGLDVQQGVPQQVSMGDTEGGVDAETGEIAAPQQVRQQQDRAAEGATRQVASPPSRPIAVPTPAPSGPPPGPTVATDVNGWKNYILAAAVYAAPAKFQRPDDGKAAVPAISAEYNRFTRGGKLADAGLDDLRAFAAHLLAQSESGNTPARAAA